MALTFALVHLRPHFNNFEVLGIHIDYGNRHESGREADYVQGWCKRHGVLFYKRAIAEVRRGVTAREEYEQVARDIRFNTYRSAMGAHGCPAVMLGHHEGDVEENVLTNLVKGCSLLCLAGMEESNIIHGVEIWRPLLPFGKDVVLDFAHRYGVPYFKDTTPSWSTRGKLRRILVPVLEDMFGLSVMAHLSKAAAESDDLRRLVHKEIFSPVWAAARTTTLGLSVYAEPHRHHGLLFWKEILRRLIHGLGMPMVRDKTLGMFVRDVLGGKNGQRTEPLRDGWVELRKEYSGYLENGYLYLFRPDVFLPPDTSYGEQAEGTRVALDGASVMVGPWEVSTRIHKTLDLEEAASYRRGRLPGLSEPPFTSMEEFMTGVFSYDLAVPDTPDAWLTIQPGAKAKVRAWNTVDTRLRRALPVVGPPEGKRFFPGETGARMITVTLAYKGLSKGGREGRAGTE
ncbi:unnamed protein product, partial [Discosporangium mesarthrocarpum]